MSRDSIRTIAVGILLVLFVLIVLELLFFRGDLSFTLIAAGVFAVLLWLYTRRSARKTE